MALTNEGLAKLDGTRAPFFPYAKEQYSRGEMDYFINMLRQYFIQNDRFTGSLIDNVGGAYLSFPNGAFQSSVTQTAANTTTAYPITFNTTDYSNGVTLESSSHLKVEYAGRYNIQFSVQLNNSTNAPQDIDIWFRKNGTDVTASNSRFGLAERKSVGDPFHIIGSLNLLIDLQSEDYVELVWCTTNVGASIVAYSAGTSPTRPAIPSVIATMTYVSRL